MTVANQNLKDAFDFSLDACAFREALLQKLMQDAQKPSVRELDDEDLTWVNAAGMLRNPQDSDDSVF